MRDGVQPKAKRNAIVRWWRQWFGATRDPAQPNSLEPERSQEAATAAGSNARNLAGKWPDSPRVAIGGMMNAGLERDAGVTDQSSSQTD
jgi:hypothetical protein